VQAQAAQNSQSPIFRAEEFEVVHNSLPLLLEPLEESYNNQFKGFLPFSPFEDSFSFVGVEQYGGSHRSSFLDAFTCGEFDTKLSYHPELDEELYERQPRRPETEAGAGWPHRHIDSGSACVGIEQTALEGYQVGGSRQGLEASRSAVEEYDINIGRLSPYRRKRGSTAEINLEGLGVEFPTDGSSHGYDTSSSLGDRPSTSQTSCHYWGPEQHSYCAYAIAAIVDLWTSQMAFVSLFLEFHCPLWPSNI
jgi:hypothetical protein